MGGGKEGRTALLEHGTVVRYHGLENSADEDDLQQFSGSVRHAWVGSLALILAVSALVVLSRLSAATPTMREPTVLMAEMPNEHATKGWKRSDRADGDQTIRLTLWIKKPDPEKLFDQALAVADPKSSQYGQHQSLDELSQWRRPTNQTLGVVREWLAERGVDVASAEAAMRATPADDMWSVSLPVRTAEELLEAKYHWYEHPNNPDARRVLRADRWTLPASVAPHIDWVSPTIQFPMVNSISTPKVTPNTPGTMSMTPNNIRTLYDIPHDEVGGHAHANKQAVAAFLEEYVSKSDINEFFADYQPDVCVTEPADAHGRGGKACSHDVLTLEDSTSEGHGMETALDLELIMSIARHVPTVFWYVSGRSADNANNEPWTKFLGQVKDTGLSKLPKVFSISYCDWEPTVSKPFAERLNEEFAELGLRGVSVLAASGDAGVEGAQPLPHPAWRDGYCGEASEFISTFPASSPFITAVGATTPQGRESAAGLSGGGFSNYFSAPAYQHPEVNSWKDRAQAKPPQWRWNAHGRGIPDVAALGTNVRVVSNGMHMISGGTSASTPIWAAIVSLLNEHRLKAGKPVMGFLNPFLYHVPRSTYNDITAGNNPGCNSAGFNAETGWDPVTGLGSPKFDSLLDQAMKYGNGHRRAAEGTSKGSAETEADMAELAAPAETPSPKRKRGPVHHIIPHHGPNQGPL